jgi:hypothetical protein
MSLAPARLVYSSTILAHTELGQSSKSHRVVLRPLQLFARGAVRGRRIPAVRYDCLWSGRHTFPATGIGDYLKNGGRIEACKSIAGNSNEKVTGLYDRRNLFP